MSPQMPKTQSSSLYFLSPPSPRVPAAVSSDAGGGDLEIRQDLVQTGRSGEIKPCSAD